MLSALKITIRKVAALFLKKKLEAEMAEEMRLHLELQTERNVAAGMSETEARYAARREFGGVEQIKEQCREQRGWTWLEGMYQDLRYAVRSLGKDPGFSTVAIVSLALGLGVNTAAFSLINETLLKTLPVKNPEELVLFQWQRGALGGGPRELELEVGGENLVFPLRTFEHFREENAVLSDVFAADGLLAVNVTIDRQSEVIPFGQVVSGNYFRMLGVSAFRGRMLLPEDDQPGAAPVVVISHRYWQKRFNGDAAAVGKNILVNRISATIVGVAPPGFVGTMLSGVGEDITLPLALVSRVRAYNDPAAKAGLWWLRIVGRLKPGVSLEQARMELEGTFRESVRGTLIQRDERDLPVLRATPGGQAKSEADRKRDLVVMAPMAGMAVLMLFAACANVANLLLARGAARRREINVRLALGASRGRLIRQLLTESGLLAVLGAGLGLIFSKWNLDLLAMLFPAGGPVKEWLANLSPDWRVLGFTGAIALGTSVAFGLVPALRATRLNLTEEFQGGARSVGGRALSRLSQTFVVIQMAVSLVLLVGTGLFMRTLANLQAVDLGIDRSNLVLFMTDASGAGYQPAQFGQLRREVLERIAVLPEVRSASYAGWHLLSGYNGMFKEVSLRGAAGDREWVTWLPVGPDFFATYAMPMIAGRSLDARDDRAKTRVAVVNEAFARKYYPEVHAIGRRIFFNEETKIVGVVRDAKHTGRDLRTPVEPMVFVPFSDSALSLTFFVVRTESDPGSIAAVIRKTIRELDPNLPLADLATQDERLHRLFQQERMFSWVAGFIGVLSLVLASVGLYGLMSYAVLRRTGEIGVRMALGALPRQVLGMILGESLSIVLVGLLVGVAAAAALAQVAASLFFGLSPTDPLTYGAVALLLAAVALAACWLPARRATRIDPMVALRSE